MKNMLRYSLYSIIILMTILIVFFLLNHIELTLFLTFFQILIGFLATVLSFQLTRRINSFFSYFIRFLVISGTAILISSLFKVDIFNILKYAYLLIFHGVIIAIWARNRVFEWNLIMRLFNLTSTLSLLINVLLTAENFYDNFQAITISLSYFSIVQMILIIKGSRYYKEANF